MKKLLTKIVAIGMAVGMLASSSVIAFATDDNNEIIKIPSVANGETVKIPVGDAKYIQDSKGNLIAISDLKKFNTQKEADAYINNVKQALQQPAIQSDAKILFNSKARSTHGDAIVASKRIGIAGYIKLRVTYTTSGDNNTGRITAHNAYTTFTGFTLGFDWEERECYSEITSSGKDIYAYTSGELIYNLLVDGFIEIGRATTTLDGYAYAIH